MGTASNTPVIPTFLYIGAAKAGSTWIYECLREHPQIFVPPAKDIKFFDKSYERGIDWYLSFFASGQDKKAVGEVCHTYLRYSELTARRIYQHFPEVRLICSLRDPIDRTISSFLFSKNLNYDEGMTFEAYAFQEYVLKQSDYYFNLQHYYDLFPRENTLVLFYEDLRKNPKAFVRTIYQFIDVDPTFEPEILYRKVLAASKPRSTCLAHQAYATARQMRQLGLANLVGAIKHNALFQKLLFRELENKPEMSEEVKQSLRDYYRKRFQGLADLIGRPLPDEWNLR